MTKAYKINAKECTVTEVEIGADFEDINRQIGCETFTVAQTEDMHLPALFVDDNGLWTDEPYFFLYRGVPQPLCGNAIAMDMDEGESIAPAVSLRDFAKAVRFVHVMKINGKVHLIQRLAEA
jgi:hypothetical protein